jgi:hypothetical protein
MLIFRLIHELETRTQSIAQLEEMIKNLETEVETKRAGNFYLLSIALSLMVAKI